ncbi:MAG: deoxyhypusine synthase family protein [Thaumarchaeota archaeon]|nr:deoxyhypusine synthase family protein [Nitrososphaerota archaeon]MDG6908642.1 deoxyhypusine synthase family protein [Nitrososphaerota archaeon]
MSAQPKKKDVSFKYFESKAAEIRLSKNVQRQRSEFLSKKVEQLDLEKVSSLRDLVSAWSRTSIQSRSIAECAAVYENMISDSDRPTVIMGLSGALIAGGLRKVIRDLVEAGFVDAIVSTGAIMYQDLYQAMGYSHFMGTPKADDAVLHDLYIDRIYDAYVDEVGFVKTDDVVGEIAADLPIRKYSTREFMHHLGMKASSDPNSIIGTAAKRGVPMFVPAIADSSIGIGLAGLYRSAKKANKKLMQLDTIQDNYEIAQIVLKSKKTGTIYIGGGVPKNYINDAAVMLDYTPGHAYVFQITTDAPHWGGLTGSTLDEAKSWGKVSKKATRATAYVEATIGLPLVAAYVLESKSLVQNRTRLEFQWDGDDLKAIRKV